MLNKIFKNIYYRLGWKTNRKIIVFLSDDWGSTRVPSASVRNELIKKGINMGSNRFNKFDALETNNDLEGLFNVLTSHKDANGQHPVITAMTNVANPDFDKIRKNDFQEYVYEPFTKSLEQNKNSDKVYTYYLKGIEEGFFYPQYHGREHLHVNRWLRALNANHKLARIAFNHRFYGNQFDHLMLEYGGAFSEAYSTDFPSDLSAFREAIRSGTELFKKLFNYSSSFFTPPGMFLPDSIDKELKGWSIKALDTQKIRKAPSGKGKFKNKLHYLGQKRTDGLIYLQRNAVFETNLDPDPVNACLSDIQNAFRFQKPAIISNHRASFIGSINSKNRDQGLKKLDQLLSSVFKKWPDAEFMNMAELITLMKRKKKGA